MAEIVLGGLIGAGVVALTLAGAALACPVLIWAAHLMIVSVVVAAAYC